MAAVSDRGSALWKGTSILVAANVGYQLIDFLYRSFLFRRGLTDAETIGLFRVVLPIYLTLSLIAGAGVPTAVGSLVADRTAAGDPDGARRVLRIALALGAAGGTLAAAALLAGAQRLAVAFARDERVGLALVALSPALLIVAISGVYRGYCQGVQRMGPVAAAQLAELVTGASVTLGLLLWVLPRDIQHRLAALAAGATAGELSALFLLRWAVGRGASPLRPWGGRPAQLGRRQALARLVWLAAPIALTRLVATLSLTISAMLIPSGLVQAGHDRRHAVALFGQLTGMAFYLVSLPHVVTGALAYNLVPEASALLALRGRERLRATIERAMALTFACAAPLAVTLAMFPGEASFLVFGTAGPAVPLALLAALSPLLYLEHVMTGLLQGLGQPLRNLRNFVLAEGATLLLIWWSVPRWGVVGAAASIAIGFSLEAIMDYLTAIALLRPRPSLLRAAGRPACAALAMAGATALCRPWAVQALGPGPAPAAVATAAGLAVYLVALWGKPPPPGHVTRRR